MCENIRYNITMCENLRYNITMCENLRYNITMLCEKKSSVIDVMSEWLESVTYIQNILRLVRFVTMAERSDWMESVTYAHECPLIG
jgi:hypothetical protein